MKLLVKSRRTLSFALLLAAGLQATPLYADTNQAMATALELAAGKDWDGALAVVPAGVSRDVIDWQRLRAGVGELAEYEAFLARHADWPGLPLMREKAEAQVALVEDPARVLAWFATSLPETGTGAVAHVRALLAVGRVAEAETEAMRAWASLPFTSAEEEALLALLPEAVGFTHELRLDTLLWEGRLTEAARMLPRLDADLQALAQARLAVQGDAKGVTATIKAVPASRAGDPGLAHDRFIWRMQKDLYDDALELILAQSASAETLGRPLAWAERRAVLTRYLVRNGRATEAYQVAANHHLTEGVDFIDLEFLAGYIALRKLDDPTTALAHFLHLETGVKTPISQARALYWQGRALEALGQDAKPSYQAAARHQTAYYGLLAAEKLGLTLDEGLLAAPRAPDSGRSEGRGWL